MCLKSVFTVISAWSSLHRVIIYRFTGGHTLGKSPINATSAWSSLLRKILCNCTSVHTPGKNRLSVRSASSSSPSATTCNYILGPIPGKSHIHARFATNSLLDETRSNDTNVPTMYNPLRAARLHLETQAVKKAYLMNHSHKGGSSPGGSRTIEEFPPMSDYLWQL